MNIETVNELIQSLESAGELSIKETKVMALAKAYQQLAAENVGLKKFIKTECFFGEEEPTIHPAIVSTRYVSADGYEPKTPATDSIYAGVKADGVEELAKRRRAAAKVALDEFNDVKNHAELESEAWRAEMFAAELRKGASE